MFTRLLYRGRRIVGRIGLERPLLIGLTLAVSGASAVVAGNGVGAVFNLGKVNTVNATTILTGAATGGSLRIRNTASAPALDLRVPSGNAPLKVNSGQKVALLNADRIDDLDSADLQRRVLGGCGIGSAISFINDAGLPACDPTAGEAQADLDTFQDRFTSNADPLTGNIGASGDPKTCMLGEVRLFAGNFAPVDWTFTRGQVMPISAWPDLYAVLGDRYGGDDTNNFGLPDTLDIEPAGMHHIMCIRGTPPQD